MSNGAAILFPGCLVSTRYPQVEATARFVLKKLGVDLLKTDGFVCCPTPIAYRGYSEVRWLTVAAWNLATAAKTGAKKIIALCSGCNTTLTEASHILSTNDDLRELVNAKLAREGLQLNSDTSVQHLAFYLADIDEKELQKPLVRRLDGLRLAVFYGCHILKPSALLKPDSVRFPRFIDRLVELTGAEAVEFSEKAACCGRSSLDGSVADDMSSSILRSAARSGADALLLVCPFCFLSLEAVQLRQKVEKELPVLFLSELFALAFGAPTETIGGMYHRIEIDSILNKYGVGGE